MNSKGLCFWHVQEEEFYGMAEQKKNLGQEVEEGGYMDMSG